MVQSIWMSSQNLSIYRDVYTIKVDGLNFEFWRYNRIIKFSISYHNFRLKLHCYVCFNDKNENDTTIYLELYWLKIGRQHSRQSNLIKLSTWYSVWIVVHVFGFSQIYLVQVLVNSCVMTYVYLVVSKKTKKVNITVIIMWTVLIRTP